MSGPDLDPLRAALERRLLALWFDEPGRLGNRALAAALAPLAALVGGLSSRRRAQVRRLAPDARPAVVVVGNLIVGGTGKTPAVIALAREMRSRGWRVGLLAGGYRGTRRDARIVSSTDDALAHGDEAVLLAAATGAPVAAARRRGAALELLERQHPELDLVISDDGLQHPGLPRTLEVVVFDARGAGNGRLLPAGPLREPLEHARSMDALLVGGADGPASGLAPDSPLARLPAFRLEVEPTVFRRVSGSPAAGTTPPGAPEELPPAEFVRRAAGRGIDAIAGIARPERFFDALRALGLVVAEHPRPDHARFDPSTLAALPAPLVVMTAKDAVKCREFADERCWALEVHARIDPAFVDWLEERLRGSSIA